MDFQREPNLAHCRAQGLLMCFELLRLGHGAKLVEVALRSVQHPDLRNTARYLAWVMRWLATERVPDRALGGVLQECLRPWIAAFPCVGIIPGAR